MISAKNCEAASELLAEREEIARRALAYRAAQICRIDIRRTRRWQNAEGKTTEHTDWDTGPEMPINKPVRQLLLAGIEAALADFDERLRALGVEPPEDVAPEEDAA